MSIEKSLCICIKCKSVTACEPLCSCFSQCDKQCGGGTKNRKIFCYIGDKLAKLQCDVNSILYSIDTCNNNPCGDGVYVFFLLLVFSFFTSIIYIFFLYLHSLPHFTVRVFLLSFQMKCLVQILRVRRSTVKKKRKRRR